MASGLVGDPSHREAPGVLDGGVEVDPVGGIGQVLTLHDECPEPTSDRRGGHDLGMVPSPGDVLGLHDGQAAAAVLDEATPDPRQPRRRRRLPRCVVAHDHVVVHMGDRPAPLAVGPIGHGAGGDRLEVGHQIAADERVVELGQEQEPRCLDSTGGDDHVTGGQEPLLTVGADHVHPGGAAAHDAHPGHEGLRQQLRPACGHGALEHGDGVALGMDGAAEEGTEAAVVAGGTGIIGNAVDGRGGRVGVIAEVLGGGGRAGGPEHGNTGGHGKRTRTAGGEGIGPLGAGHPDGPLHLGVVRLQLVIVEGPVGHFGIGLGSELGQHPEVVRAETGHLAVGMDAPAPDRGGHRVELADVDTVAVSLFGPERTGLDEGVGSEEIPVVKLDLVIRVVEGGLAQVVGIEEVVATLLDDGHGPARRRQHVGRRGASRSRPDDHGIDRHGSLTSASVHPRGCTSPSNPMAVHPLPFRFPPYSGAPYMPSQT